MRYLSMLLIGLFLSLCSTFAQADTINLLQVQNKPLTLLENPNAKSQTIATIAAGETIIPFFEQRDWVKVANPKNGQVGWVEKKDLTQNTLTVVSVNNSGSNQYIVTQKSSSGNNKVYSTIQYSNDDKLNQKHAEELMKQIQQQQQQIREHFNKVFAQPIIIIQQPAKTENKK